MSKGNPKSATCICFGAIQTNLAKWEHAIIESENNEGWLWLTFHPFLLLYNISSGKYNPILKNYPFINEHLRF